jgi:hypothetical protein
MAPGTTLQLTAIGVFSNNSSRRVQEVTWSSEDESLAAVDDKGLITAAPAGSGSTVISALSGSIVGSTVITVAPLASISISPPSGSLAPGTSQNFAATAVLANSARQDVTGLSTWVSSDAGIAAVSGAGFATAATGTTGTAIVSATFSGITGTALLTTAPVTALSIVPDSAAVVQGTTLRFRAAGTLSNNSVQDITTSVIWSAEPQSVASISGSGLAVGNSAGTALISATFGGIPGSAVLTVTAPSLSSIRISPQSTGVPAGEPVQFKALALFSDGSQQDVTADVAWISSNAAIATIGNDGAMKGVASTLVPGTTSISATLFGVTSDQGLLTVSSPAAAGQFSLTPLNPVARPGTTVPFTLLTLSPTGAVLLDATSTAVWSSSNSAVAFVSQGQVFALAPGTTVISATVGGSLISTNLTVTAL